MTNTVTMEVYTAMKKDRDKYQRLVTALQSKIKSLEWELMQERRGKAERESRNARRAFG